MESEEFLRANLITLGWGLASGEKAIGIELFYIHFLFPGMSSRQGF